MKWKFAAKKWAAYKFASGRFAGLGADVVPYTPVVHYHTIEGPSKKRRSLVGPDATPHIIEGPSKRTKQLTGAN